MVFERRYFDNTLKENGMQIACKIFVNCFPPTEIKCEIFVN